MIFDYESGLSDEYINCQGFSDFDPEGPISIHSMSHYGKQPQYDMLSMSFPSNGNEMSDPEPYGFLSSSYGPHVTNQDVLTAIPQENAAHFFASDAYAQRYDYASEYAAMEPPRCQTVDPDHEQPSTQTNNIASENQQASRKRKASVGLDEVESFHVKRSAVAQVQIQDPNGDYYDLSGQTSPYSSLVPTPVAGPLYHPHQTLNGSPRGVGHQYSTSNASQISLAAPSPHTPAFSPSFTTVKTEHSPRAPMTPAPRPASAVSPFNDSNPKLVRTSTIPQQASPGMGNVVGVAVQNFNPYNMYPHNKASLRLHGDLDAVGKTWSPEELELHRKLVVFTRNQTGSVIDAEFEVIPQQDYNRQAITVNCIWWKERNEAFVTSVDTIALLEALVHVRFTVEEKNRIRRNLEGFRPQTVSKSKSDSEEFFKIIMGFPAPKPRNIEKDVKVFPWRILKGALQKIISKYSASYSSTASTLGGPAASHLVTMDGSSEYPYTHTPNREDLGRMPPMSYAGGYETAVMPSRMQMAPTSAPDLHLQMPAMASGYEIMPSNLYEPVQYAQGPMYYAPHQQQQQPLPPPPPPQQPMSAPIHRVHSPWTYDSLPRGNIAMAPASAPVTAHPRSMVETADFAIPAHYHATRR